MARPRPRAIHDGQGEPPSKLCLLFAHLEIEVVFLGAWEWGGQLASVCLGLQINDEIELEALCAEIASQHLATESPDSPNKPCCRFTYLTMTGEEVELCSRGRHIPVA